MRNVGLRASNGHPHSYPVDGETAALLSAAAGERSGQEQLS